MELNAAAGLHSILERMVASTQTTIHSGWEEVLGEPYGTAEFSLRHAEVVGLFGRTVSRLFALPEGHRARVRYSRYVPNWYTAVVPYSAWHTAGQPASSVISQGDLDHLGGFADWVAERDRDLGEGIPDAAMDRLREGLDTWKELLAEAALPESLRDQITAQVSHIEWLLSQIDLFGPQPVIQGASSLVGTGLQALAFAPTFGKKIARASARLTAAIAIITAPIAVGNNLYAELEVMGENIQELAERGDAPRELEEAASEGPATVPDTHSDAIDVEYEELDDAESTGSDR